VGRLVVQEARPQPGQPVAMGSGPKFTGRRRWQRGRIGVDVLEDAEQLEGAVRGQGELEQRPGEQLPGSISAIRLRL